MKEAELPNGSTGNRPTEHDVQNSKGNAGYPAGRVQQAYTSPETSAELFVYRFGHVMVMSL